MTFHLHSSTRSAVLHKKADVNFPEIVVNVRPKSNMLGFKGWGLSWWLVVGCLAKSICVPLLGLAWVGWVGGWWRQSATPGH